MSLIQRIFLTVVRLQLVTFKFLKNRALRDSVHIQEIFLKSSELTDTYVLQLSAFFVLTFHEALRKNLSPSFFHTIDFSESSSDICASADSKLQGNTYNPRIDYCIYACDLHLCTRFHLITHRAKLAENRNRRRENYRPNQHRVTPRRPKRPENPPGHRMGAQDIRDQGWRGFISTGRSPPSNYVIFKYRLVFLPAERGQKSWNRPFDSGPRLSSERSLQYPSARSLRPSVQKTGLICILSYYNPGHK